ncbi:MAG: triple tyrosine motif-containing protein [Ferruginibacter sp.]
MTTALKRNTAQAACLLFFSFSCKMISGQSYNYSNLQFKQYDVTNGLSSSALADLYKDDYGYLWIVTFYGVSVFNGNSFYNIPLYNAAGKYTVGATPQGFLQLDKNRMLITSTEGLYIFYYQTNRVEKQEDVSALFKGTRPVILGWDASKEAFLIKAGSTVYRFNKQMMRQPAFECTNEVRNISVKSNLPDLYCYCTADNYIVGINKTTARRDTVLQLSSAEDGVVICGMYNNNYIVATQSGVLTVDPKQKKAVGTPAALPRPNRPFCSAKDKNGDYWIGGSGGLMIYFPKANKAVVADGISNTSVVDKIDFGIVTELLNDGSNLFVSTANSGLFVYNNADINFANYYFPGKKHNSVWSISVGGRLLCTTNTAGITSFPRYSGADRNIMEGYTITATDERYKNIIQFETIDSAHTWVMARENFKLGIALEKDMSLVQTQFQVDSLMATYFRTQNFRFPSPDRRPLLKKINEHFFYFTINNKLFSVTGSVQKGYQFNLLDSVASSSCLTALNEVEPGKVLVGTNNFEVFMLENNKLQKKYTPGTSMQLPVRTIEKDEKGNLYLLSPNGLYILDRNYNFSKRLTDTNTALLSNMLYAGAMDRQKVLWMSTNGGICAYNTNTNRIYSFRSTNLLFNKEFNTRCVTRDGDGNIYFGGIQGVSVVRNSSFNVDTSAGRLYFSQIINGDSVLHTGLTPGSFGPKGHFAYNHNSFEFQVGVISFRQTEGIRVKYFLEGIDTKWNDAGTDRRIIFTGLAPGTYTLKVKEALSVDDTGGVPITYSFVIAKPVWLQTWFLLLAGVMIASLGVLLVTYFMRRKMERQRIKASLQMALKNERERISQELHDDLGSGLTSIRLISKSVISRPNGENTPVMLNNIARISGELIDQMSEIIWVLNNIDDTLNGLLAHIRVYMADYLSRIERRVKLEIHNNTEDSYKMANTERRNLLLVMKETFHNMIKHSGATEFSINCTEKNGVVFIEIKDNGSGIPEHISKKGNGLNNIQKRIKAINGTVQFIPGNGAHIIIELPNKKSTI